MSNEPPVEFVATLVTDTERAWLLRGLHDRDLWVPKSVCANVDGIEQTKRGVFEIAYWFAKKEGLI